MRCVSAWRSAVIRSFLAVVIQGLSACRCLRSGIADVERVANRVGELGAIERVKVELLHAVLLQRLNLLDRDRRRDQAAGVRIVVEAREAPMEPRAAVAEWQDGRLTVWTGTQQPARVQRELAEAFRIPQERVRVIVPDTGGAFGGKHTGDAAVEAARLAQAAGRPVSLRWTRAEEFTWAYFRPAALIETKAGLDAGGKVLAWEFTNFNSGASALESPYEIAHARETFRYCESPLREGSYRVLAATANNFARESFMDELAAAAATDPLDYRLACLKNERLRAVLEAAAERFRWRERRKQRQEGRGIGLACGTEKGSYVAACVEVEAGKARGSLRVLEICEAYECGAIQNPDNLRAQVEGCIIMTLGGALSEEIRFEDGRILNRRFSQYVISINWIGRCRFGCARF
jgi:isoquinoline 1-oxidoreductase